MNKKGNILLNAPYILWAVLFIIVPLLFVAYYTFTTSDGTFTFANITTFFTSSAYMTVFGRSMLYAFWATLICLLIGYPFAYCMTKAKLSSQRMLMLLVMLPMLMNLVVRTYSWQQILEQNGIVNTFLEGIGLEPIQFLGNAGVIVFGMVYNYLPFMIMPLYSVMTKIDDRTIEAAQDLGCNNVRTLFKVVFPLSVPGVISGITMVFVPAVSTFYISQKLGAGKIDLVGDTIERLFQNASTYNVGAAMSLVMMILILISVCIMNRFSDDEGGQIK